MNSHIRVRPKKNQPLISKKPHSRFLKPSHVRTWESEWSVPRNEPILHVSGRFHKREAHSVHGQTPSAGRRASSRSASHKYRTLPLRLELTPSGGEPRRRTCVLPPTGVTPPPRSGASARNPLGPLNAKTRCGMRHRPRSAAKDAPGIAKGSRPSRVRSGRNSNYPGKTESSATNPRRQRPERHRYAFPFPPRRNAGHHAARRPSHASDGLGR